MPVAAVGSFISDVIQPLAPLSTYVFWASCAGTILLILGVLIARKARPSLLPLLILTSSFFTFSCILMIFQSEESQAKGVLATEFPAIARLQQTLGLIQQDVAEIKETAKRTEEAVARVEESTRRTQQTTESIARSLETIQQGFAGLNKSGGVIENADKPEQHYHNARLYEQRGDYANARRSYNTFFAHKLNFVDPHLRYQSFLKIQEGHAGAREIYSALYEQDQRPLLEFARILLFDAPQRTEMLKRFLDANPDFAPGYYELSREYSATRKGAQSFSDKKTELEALEWFKALHAEGKFVKYFIDQGVAAEWLADADKRLKSLEAVKRMMSEAPVTMSAMRSNSGWTVSLNFKEMPREIFYKLDGEDSFRSTGLGEITDSATGLKLPKTFFSLKPNIASTTVHIKYTDVGGEIRGPFELRFDPDSALVEAQKKMLDLTKNSWLAFRDFDGKLLLYFTHLISNRCAIGSVAYGIDSQTTPSQFELEPCNKKDPYNVGDGLIYIEVPTNSQFASVRLTYKDGTQSETVRIDR